MGSTQVVRSGAMLLSCRVCLPGVGTLHQANKVGATLNETCRMITGSMSEADKYQQSARTRRNRPVRHQESVGSRTERTRQTTDERHPLNGHLAVVSRLKSRKSLIKSTEHINTTARAARLELWRERLEHLNTSVHLTSVLTNTSQLAQRTPGQPGALSIGCVHRLAGQEWTCWSRDLATNKKRVIVASGRPCNTYWSAPWWTLPANPMTWQWLTASPSAVSDIGRSRFDEHTTPGRRTRMMMTALCVCSWHFHSSLFQSFPPLLQFQHQHVFLHCAHRHIIREHHLSVNVFQFVFWSCPSVNPLWWLKVKRNLGGSQIPLQRVRSCLHHTSLQFRTDGRYIIMYSCI